MPARSQGPNWSKWNFLSLVAGCKRAPVDLSHRSGRAVCGDTKRHRMNDFSFAQGDPLLADGQVDRLFLVNPCRDPRGRDTQPQRIPASQFEFAGERSFVHRGVRAVDAGEADYFAAPSAVNPGAKGVAHRKGDAREEVA